MWIELARLLGYTFPTTISSPPLNKDPSAANPLFKSLQSKASATKIVPRPAAALLTEPVR